MNSPAPPISIRESYRQQLSSRQHEAPRNMQWQNTHHVDPPLHHTRSNGIYSNNEPRPGDISNLPFQPNFSPPYADESSHGSLVEDNEIGEEVGEDNPEDEAIIIDDLDQEPILPEDNTDQHIEEQIRKRGKGNYTCPEGLRCKLGGVVEGKLRTFERHCDIRAHLDRHKKPFKCELPGCTNKKGFARKDQLERHQRDVKHRQPNILQW
jgi:hypothetical protein